MGTFDRLPEGLTPAEESVRLHAEKNAPWVNGPYSHLKFPPPKYPPEPYPRMLYHPSYKAAQEAMTRALRLPGRGSDDRERAQAIVDAERLLADATIIVGNEEEHRRRRGEWFDSPTEAMAAVETQARALAQQAAESAWADRRLSPEAKAERKAYDADAENHVVDVPRPRGRPRKQED